MLQALARAISRRLCHEAHRDAERYHRLRGELDTARQWLGVRCPEGASVAQWALDRDHFYWTSEEPARPAGWIWQPPAYVSDISSFRAWLESRPFGPRPIA